MLNHTKSRSLLVALAVAVVSACGGPSEPADPGAANEAVIVVDNTETTESDLTINLVPAQGAERRLGRVSLNEEASFRVGNLNWGAQYRLEAEDMTGNTLRSRPFTLTPGSVMEWDLNLNTVTFGGQQLDG